jgi:hypothetical protein
VNEAVEQPLDRDTLLRVIDTLVDALRVNQPSG